MADEEKKERNNKVTRFGKERFPDEPVAYRPIVRKGGRKQGKADALQSRVPVKSSVSNPFEEKLKGSAVKRIKRTEQEDPQNTHEAIPGRIRRTVSPETAAQTSFSEPETSREFSWDDLENLFSLPPKDPEEDRMPQKNIEDVLSHAENTEAEQEVYPDSFVPPEITIKKTAIADTDPMKLTPFNRRKEAIACGVPPRFFYAMSKDGFLDGEITEERVKTALDAFYRRRVQERITNSNLTTREFDIVMQEIENIRQGTPEVLKTSDLREDMSPDELCKAIIDCVRLRTRR